MGEKLHPTDQKSSITSERLSFGAEEKALAFSQMEKILARFEAIIQKINPEAWYKPLAREFSRLEKNTGELHPLVRSFVTDVSPEILEAFKQELEQNSPEEQEKLIEVFSSIKSFAEKLQPDIEQERMPYVVINFEQLQKSKEIIVEERGDKRVIKIHLNAETVEVPFPEAGVLYKGGIARILAKIFTGSSLNGESSKLDIDLIVEKGDTPIEETLKRYGASLTDVEIVKKIDPGRLLATRDIDMNAVLVSKDGLLLTEVARKACETRIIHPLLPKERELYGRSTFKVGNIDLTRSVLLYRLIRIVVDNKASAFEIKRAETQVPLGIYWLVLTRHYLGKPKREKNVRRLFKIAREMNQVGESKNPVEWLQGLLREYPEFNFESRGLSKQDYARWLFGKFLKLVSAKYKHATEFYQKNFTIEDPDTALQLIKIPEIQSLESDTDNADLKSFLTALQGSKRI